MEGMAPIRIPAPGTETGSPSLIGHCACAPDAQPASSTVAPCKSPGTSALRAGRSRNPLNGPSSVVDDHTAASRSYASRVRSVCSAWLSGISLVTGRA